MPIDQIFLMPSVSNFQDERYHFRNPERFPWVTDAIGCGIRSDS